MNKFKKSLLERTNIETNKQFQRLAEKTQVLVPRNGLVECTKNRLTHSYEVATSALLIATDIAEKLNVSVSDIDYNFSLFNTCLLHDIGQSPFGHDGQKVIHNYFIEKGLSEGFDDNNNNLSVIEKNHLLVDSYTVASLIKYPHKLYSYQKEIYLPILESAIAEDSKQFKDYLNIDLIDQKRTIACQIMDEADRNSYVCSDLADFLCLGNSIPLREMRDIAKKGQVDLESSELGTLANMIRSGSKTAIKAYFNDLKNRFNSNYTITEKGLNYINKDLHDYREFLSKIEFKFFIKPKQNSEEHVRHLKELEAYIDFVVTNKYYPSKTYRKLILSCDDELQKLRLIRDMVGENTDWYIINYTKKIKENLLNQI